jgi:hypothetical protein
MAHPDNNNTLLARFRSKVVVVIANADGTTTELPWVNQDGTLNELPTDVCWTWRGEYNNYGYGRIRRGGRGTQKALAHRISFELWWDCEIGEGLVMCHKCDNPACVNPHHLWPDTQQNNMKDMVAKGRWSNGRPTESMKKRATPVALCQRVSTEAFAAFVQTCRSKKVVA